MAKTCFVISVIGKDGSSERKHADQFLDYIVKPVITQLGYDKPVRADQISQPGMITNQIVSAIIDADLVVADLSFENGNVFYELAIRHVAQKPVIHMAIKDAKLPFDNAQARTIFFGTQVDEAEQAKEKLRQHIESLEKSSTSVDNPVAQALQIEKVADSKDVHAETLAALLRRQSEIMNTLSVVAESINQMEHYRRASQLASSILGHAETPDLGSSLFSTGLSTTTDPSQLVSYPGDISTSLGVTTDPEQSGESLGGILGAALDNADKEGSEDERT